MITRVDGEAFYLDVKNRIEMGDVLEFVPHGARESLLLRIYEFQDTVRNLTTREEGVHAGRRPVIRIPFSWFHEEDQATLARDFPAFTVVRKERALSKDHWERMKLDRTARSVELGNASEDDYKAQRDTLVATIETEHEGVTFRTPRVGVNGCCGRGCNGCLPFWNDPKYARARELLHTKKHGAMLTNEEVQKTRGAA